MANNLNEMLLKPGDYNICNNSWLCHHLLKVNLTTLLFQKGSNLTIKLALQLLLGPFLHHHSTLTHVPSNSFRMILCHHFGFPLKHHQHHKGWRCVGLRSCSWLLTPNWGVSSSFEWCRHCWIVIVVPVRWSTSMWPCESRSCSGPHGWGHSITSHPNPSEPHGVLQNYITYFFLVYPAHRDLLYSKSTWYTDFSFSVIWS